MKKSYSLNEQLSRIARGSLIAPLAALAALVGCSDGDAVFQPQSVDVESTADAPATQAVQFMHDLRVGRIDTRVVELRWTAPWVTQPLPGAAAYYRVFYVELKDTDSVNGAGLQVRDIELRPRHAGLPERYLFDGLNPGANYRLWIRAYDESGTRSGGSNPAEFETEELTPISPGDRKEPSDQG